MQYCTYCRFEFDARRRLAASPQRAWRSGGTVLTPIAGDISATLQRNFGNIS
jgi:hypothetical protein